MQTKWIERAKEVLNIEIGAIAEVRDNLDDSFNAAVQCLGTCTGRVAVTGIGKSGLVGKKIAATLSSTGTPAFFLHPVEGAHGDLGSIRAGDVILAISYSGKTPELNAILPSLRSLGTHIIALTSGLDAPLAHLADIVIDITVQKEACPMNLAPTSSTTATLALGDALAICLIEMKSFTAQDFKKVHPAGALGQRLALSVADIMHVDNIPLASLGTTLEAALSTLNKHGFGGVILTDDSTRLLGIITDGDIRRAICNNTLYSARTAQDIMTKDPLRAFVNQSVADIMDIMEKYEVTFLPVVDQDAQVVGVIHLHDILGKGTLTFSQ